MSVKGIIFVVVFAIIGVFCLRVLLHGLRTGIIRPWTFYGPIARKEVSPTDFWHAVFYWSAYTATAFSMVFFCFYDPSML